MTDRRVRVGLVGLGRLGCFHASNLMNHVASAELVRIVDADDEVARKVSEQMGGVDWSTTYENLLEDPGIEAIFIVTPTPFHADMIEAAAAARKHVFCEKPVSFDPGRTYQAMEVAASANIKVQVGFQRRFDPDLRDTQRRTAGGEIGNIYLFRVSSRDMKTYSFDFLRSSGGIFADLSLHDFDMARWLVGEVEEVTAIGAALSDSRYEGIGDLDNAVVILRFAGGALGIIDNSRVSGYGYECSSEIMGSQATLRIDSVRQQGPDLLTPETLQRTFLSEPTERWATAYLRELEEFVRVVAHDEEPEVGIMEDAAALTIAQAADRSYREGRTVQLASEMKADRLIYREIVQP